MIPPIVEPILAGVFVSLFNKYILNQINPSVLCCKTTHETVHESDRDESDSSTTTTSINSDINHIHVVH